MPVGAFETQKIFIHVAYASFRAVQQMKSCCTWTQFRVSTQSSKKAGVTPRNAAHTHTQAHLITTVRENTGGGVLAHAPPTNSSHLRNLTLKEGDSADVKQTEWTRTKHLHIKCSMTDFPPLHEIPQGDLKKILQRESVTCFSHRCFLLLIDCYPHIIQNKAPSSLTDGLASNIVACFLLFWFYVTSVDTDKTTQLRACPLCFPLTVT